MIDVNLIRENPQKVVDALAKRGYSVDFTEYFALDGKRRNIIKLAEKLKAERNSVSAKIPALKKLGENVDTVIARMREVGDKIAGQDKRLARIDKKINDFLLSLPNMPDDDIIAGGKENNQVIKVVGEKPNFDFKIKDHVDLCKAHNLIDYERGSKLSGAGSWIYRGDGARLEWALLNYFVSMHLKDGYEFILPPHMLQYSCGLGSGQFPKFSEEVYWTDDGDGRTRFMLPTAETALVNMYANEIVDEDKLPMKLFAFTPCYRKEAGSYRQEERGMIRGHQFNKIEMVQITKPEDSAKAFDELVGKACAIMDGLGVHYRVSKLAAGDVSASMARTYDIEVWLPSMGIYKEVSSVSNSNDYQARRSMTRYRDKATGKPVFVHTLNGSGLATSRILPAIVEQFQNSDGSITIPEVLRGFMGMDVLR